MFANSADERVLWLERSDQTNPFVAADLHATRAEQALINNDHAAAESHYGDAIEAYLNTPEGSSRHNNIALIYMDRYDISGNQSDFDLALENIDSAVELEPDDSIILYNAATLHAANIYGSLLTERVDLSLLKRRASRNLLSYFYDSSAAKKQLIAQAQAHASHPKMMDYLNRALLLAPKNSNVFATAYGTYHFERRGIDLGMLLDRLSLVAPQLSSAEDLSRYRSGSEDAESIISLQEAISQHQEYYPELDPESHPLEYLILDIERIEYQLSMADYGEFGDLDQMQDRARMHYQNYPSSSTRNVYRKVLVQRLIRALRAEVPEFEHFYQEYNRVFGRQSLLTLAAQSIPGFVERIKQNSELNLLLEEINITHQAFSDWPGQEDWFFFNALKDNRSTRLKTDYQNFELGPILQELALGFSTIPEQKLLLEYQELAIHDRVDEANQLWEQGFENNLKLPDIHVN